MIYISGVSSRLGGLVLKSLESRGYASTSIGRDLDGLLMPKGTLIHIAGSSHTSQGDGSDIYIDNVLLTNELLNRCSNDTRVVFVSTRSEPNFNENVGIDKKSFYAISKRYCEYLVGYRQCNTVVVRCPAIVRSVTGMSLLERLTRQIYEGSCLDASNLDDEFNMVVTVSSVATFLCRLACNDSWSGYSCVDTGSIDTTLRELLWKIGHGLGLTVMINDSGPGTGGRELYRELGPAMEMGFEPCSLESIASELISGIRKL
jgi:nucleoside-diphosphate-sugar epimerase